MKEKIDELENKIERLSSKRISRDKIESIVGDIRGLSSKVDHNTKKINDVEKDIVRIDIEGDQIPEKLQKLPDPEYLDQMVDSVKNKLDQKIENLSSATISRKELYGYAALISFFTTLIVSIVTFLLTFGLDFVTINAG